MEQDTRPRGGILGAVALLAAGGLVGAVLTLSGGAVAQTSTPSQSTESEEAPKETKRGKPGRGMGHGKFGGPGIHGEFVVPNGSGGYQTIVNQRGEATAVSATSITVKSEDGYSATYVVNADTLVNAARDGISTIKVGDTVHVTGIRSGDTRTAVHISDGTLMKQGRDRLRPRPPAASNDA